MLVWAIIRDISFGSVPFTNFLVYFTPVERNLILQQSVQYNKKATIAKICYNAKLYKQF